MTLRTRRPSGAVPWPLILIEGPEKAGKSYSVAILSASKKVGATYWLDLSEGSADEYGAIPGARYEVILHDGSWATIVEQVHEAKAEAARVAEAGDPPVVLVIDSMTAEWDLLKDWATHRAKGSDSNKARLQRDPNAEIKVPMNLWNDATARHRRLMTMLMTFPGIVVMTARGKEVASLDDNGRPIENTKEYKVEGHKTLAFDASVWVRLSRDAAPVVVGARSVHTGIRPGRDEPQSLSENWTIEELVFDLLKCDPSKAHVRDLIETKHERTPEQIRDEALKSTTTPEQLRALYTEAKNLGYGEVVVSDGNGREGTLPDLLVHLGKTRSAQPADPIQERLRNLWAQTEVADDADARARWMSEIVGRPVESEKDLSDEDRQRVIARLDAYVAKNMPPVEKGEAA